MFKKSLYKQCGPRPDCFTLFASILKFVSNVRQLCAPDDIFKCILDTLGLRLLPVSYLLNMHAQLLSGARSPNVCLRLYLFMFFVYLGSKCLGVSAHMNRHV